MSAPVNLNKVRKDRARAAKRLRADQNAVTFGRTKAQKELVRARVEKQTRETEAHKRET